MDNLKISGSPAEIIFELKATREFLLRFYDIQDKETQDEIDISVEDINKKIKELEDI